MWKSILLNSAFLNRGRYLGLNRTYLTETCKLNSEWAARLKTPILEKVNIENYFYELDTKFSQQKVLSFIDVDIYANKISDDKHIDEIADLLHKLRTTAEAHKLCESTSHAVIRNYIDTNHIDSLVQVLDHRLEYGVFLDPFAANILLDKLIEEKNFKLGARMATILALQEDFENPITRYMALYSCYKFLENLEEFDDLIVHKPEDAPSDGKKKKVEEIKVRVRYIRNTFSDDHFDLRISNHLLGKAFIVLGDEVRSCNETLAYSCKLIGFALYEKFDLANLLVSDQVPFFKEAVEFVRRLVSKCKSIESNEAAKRFLDSIDGIQNSVDANVGELIEGHLKKAIADNLQKDIQHQKQTYAEWIKERDEKLNFEIQRLNRIQRLKNIEKLQEELQSEEKKLWFFENEDKIDLEIDSKNIYYPKRWFGKKKKPRVIDQHYIPPDVDSRRNVK